MSCPIDDKGYFLAKLSPPSTKFLKNVEWELEEWKAFLKSSSLKDCKVPIEINEGVTCAHCRLARYHEVERKQTLGTILSTYYKSIGLIEQKDETFVVTNNDFELHATIERILKHFKSHTSPSKLKNRNKPEKNKA
ncbi:hypothetical protein L6452_22123 [Arctium lappa]|uniref:Uncharacterized protein n=1 Tax=Arctium lappa TaxID=4217 RepID=A0ACB9AZ97_ARCLA|nr:hypothetical protein L6452_22123 [Arctium lappa]